jgi:catechol 2,3-dioxygenase-like lactoylglutathione lyase family enzyme
MTMTSWHWPAKLPVRYVRIARPTDQLDGVVRFYHDGLGLPELERFAGHAGHAGYRGVVLGLPGTQYHLEFTQHDYGSPGPAPSRDNLLVLYFDDPAQIEQVATRLVALGHRPVEAENPYWTENGAITLEDPDHWRVVLMPQSPAGLVDAMAMTTCWPIRSTWFWGPKGWPRGALMSRKKKRRLLAWPPGARPTASSSWKTSS